MVPDGVNLMALILSQKVCLISSKKRADPCVSALKFVI